MLFNDKRQLYLLGIDSILMVSQLPASFGDTFERKVYFCKKELFHLKKMDRIFAEQNRGDMRNCILQTEHYQS